MRKLVAGTRTRLGLGLVLAARAARRRAARGGEHDRADAAVQPGSGRNRRRRSRRTTTGPASPASRASSARTSRPRPATDPQTLLGDFGASRATSRCSRTRRTRTCTNGGVAEFDGSRTRRRAARAPAPPTRRTSCSHLNTTGQVGRHRRLQPPRHRRRRPTTRSSRLRSQYRVGTSGNFTNVAGRLRRRRDDRRRALATLVTPVSAALPAAADNQARRSGPDHHDERRRQRRVGRRRRHLGHRHDRRRRAPFVASTTPANGATGVGDERERRRSRSARTSTSTGYDSSRARSLGPRPRPSAAARTTFTLDPSTDFVNGDVCTVTVGAASRDRPGRERPAGQHGGQLRRSASRSARRAACRSRRSTTIQGSGASAAITGNVTTQGVVVGDFEGDGRGSAASTSRIRPATATPRRPTASSSSPGAANTVSAGDLVRVTGFARERFNADDDQRREQQHGGGHEHRQLRHRHASRRPTSRCRSRRSTFAERYEGMSVRLPQSLVISEYFNYDRFGEIVLALPIGGETRPFTPTAIEEPGSAALHAPERREPAEPDHARRQLGVQNPRVPAPSERRRRSR